ncbi:hypothetical protein ACTXT7_012692 [Hymenolepis weldensis]
MSNDGFLVSSFLIADETGNTINSSEFPCVPILYIEIMAKKDDRETGSRFGRPNDFHIFLEIMAVDERDFRRSVDSHISVYACLGHVAGGRFRSTGGGLCATAFFMCNLSAPFTPILLESTLLIERWQGKDGFRSTEGIGFERRVLSGAKNKFIAIKVHKSRQVMQVLIILDHKFEAVKAVVELLLFFVLSKNFFHDLHCLRVTEFIKFLWKDEF